MVRRVVFRNELIRAGHDLARSIAHFVRGEGLIEEDLIGGVVEAELDGIRGEMWHNVLVVHYPVDILYLLVDIFGKMRVADPGRAEVVHLDAQLRQQSPYLDSGYRC